MAAFVTYQPGGTATSDHPPATHRGKEYGYVLSGRLEVEVGDETVRHILTGFGKASVILKRLEQDREG